MNFSYCSTVSASPGCETTSFDLAKCLKASKEGFVRIEVIDDRHVKGQIHDGVNLLDC